MDYINKKIEKLDSCDLNCNVFSAYDYDGLSIQELLCQFYTRINECVDLSNKTFDLAEWLVNEGLSQEVAKKFDEWLKDGTWERIIGSELLKRVRYYKTYGDMVADTQKIEENASIITQGYYTPNDGGGAEYIKKNGQFELVIKSGKLNVNQIGLTSGKYINDFWDNIKTLCETKKYTIYFPKGQYKVKTVAGNKILQSKFISMEGDGIESKIILDNSITSNDTIFEFTKTVNNWGSFIRNLSFEPQVEWQPVNRLFEIVVPEGSDTLYNLQVEHNNFGKFNGWKIYTLGQANGGFYNCKFHENTVYGPFLYSASFGDGNKITNNIFYGYPRETMPTVTNWVISTPGAANIQVVGNDCSAGLGIFQNMTNAKFQDNQIECAFNFNGSNYALEINSGTNNTVENCNLNGSNRKECIKIDCEDAKVTNCTLFNPKTYFIDAPNHAIISNRLTFEGSSYSPSKIKGVVTNLDLEKGTEKYFVTDDSILHVKFASAPKTFDMAGLHMKVRNFTTPYVQAVGMTDISGSVGPYTINSALKVESATSIRLWSQTPYNGYVSVPVVLN